MAQTWVFNDTIENYGARVIEFEINFTSGGEEFFSITYNGTSSSTAQLSYSINEERTTYLGVYSNESWIERYKIVTLDENATGDLLTFLQTVATQTNIYNKVVYNGKTLIDLSSDTVTSATLLQGKYAHDKNGAAILGSLVQKTIDPDATSVSYTSNGTYEVTPTDYDGMSKVEIEVDVSGGGSTLTDLVDTVDYNDVFEYDPSEYGADGFSSVKITVNVEPDPPELEYGEGTPTTGEQYYYPSEDYAGFEHFYIYPIPLTDTITTGTTGYTCKIG